MQHKILTLIIISIVGFFIVAGGFYYYQNIYNGNTSDIILQGQKNKSESNVAILYGRLYSDYQGFCFLAHDKVSYELKGDEKMISDVFTKTEGKTIKIDGKRSSAPNKNCQFSFELSSWSFYPDGDESAQWDTYQNEYYGYEIKYPRWWNHSTGKELDTSEISFGPLGQIVVTVQRKENASTQKDIIASIGSVGTGEGETEILEQENLTIEGYPAKRIKTLYHFKQQTAQETVILETEKYLFTINNSDAENFDSYQRPYDALMAMLETLRLYKNASTAIPPDWIHFVNKKFKYSFYYPSNWVPTEAFGTDIYFTDKSPVPIFRINVNGNLARQGYNYPQFLAPFFKQRDWKEIVADGMTGFSFSKNTDNLIYLPHRDSVHLLWISYSKEARETVDTIINTLQFD